MYQTILLYIILAHAGASHTQYTHTALAKEITTQLLKLINLLLGILLILDIKLLLFLGNSSLKFLLFMQVCYLYFAICCLLTCSQASTPPYSRCTGLLYSIEIIRVQVTHSFALFALLVILSPIYVFVNSNALALSAYKERPYQGVKLKQGTLPCLSYLYTPGSVYYNSFTTLP